MPISSPGRRLDEPERLGCCRVPQLRSVGSIVPVGQSEQTSSGREGGRPASRGAARGTGRRAWPRPGLLASPRGRERGRIRQRGPSTFAADGGGGVGGERCAHLPMATALRPTSQNFAQRDAMEPDGSRYLGANERTRLASGLPTLSAHLGAGRRRDGENTPGRCDRNRTPCCRCDKSGIENRCLFWIYSMACMIAHSTSTGYLYCRWAATVLLVGRRGATGGRTSHNSIGE